MLTCEPAGCGYSEPQAADATRKIAPNDLDECPVGTWDGLNANTWPEYSHTFGTIHHILPDPSF